MGTLFKYLKRLINPSTSGKCLFHLPHHSMTSSSLLIGSHRHTVTELQNHQLQLQLLQTVHAMDHMRQYGTPKS